METLTCISTPGVSSPGAISKLNWLNHGWWQNMSFTFKTTAFAVLSLLAAQAMAASGTLEVTAPKNNGSARIFVTDLTGGTITANVNNIAGNWTAMQKRDAIFNAIQAQAATNGWGIVKKGAAGITITNGPNDPLVINFNPRGTGEARDVIVGARGATFRGGHGTMDPHAPANGMSLFQTDGAPASFTAGLTISGTEYVTTLFGDSPLIVHDIGGSSTTASGTSIGNALYSELVKQVPTNLVVLSNTNGVIGVDFGVGTGDYGIIWGTTSEIGPEAELASGDFGYLASLEISPEKVCSPKKEEDEQGGEELCMILPITVLPGDLLPISIDIGDLNCAAVDNVEVTMQVSTALGAELSQPYRDPENPGDFDLTWTGGPYDWVGTAPLESISSTLTAHQVFAIGNVPANDSVTITGHLEYTCEGLSESIDVSSSVEILQEEVVTAE